jgi:hypothetical protein
VFFLCLSRENKIKQQARTAAGARIDAQDFLNFDFPVESWLDQYITFGAIKGNSKLNRFNV